MPPPPPTLFFCFVMLYCSVLLNTVLCVVMSQVCIVLKDLSQAETETGCITALMKSVRADCTQGQLAAAAAAALLTTTQGSEKDSGVGVGGQDDKQSWVDI